MSPQQLIQKITLPDIPELPKAEGAWPPKSVFLTGVTGFLGIYMLRDLMHALPETTFTCLVRAKDVNAAQARIAESLKTYKLDVTGFAERIVAVCGDLRQPRLGLDDSSYERICQESDLIIHSAAYVNWAYSFERLVPYNVNPVYDILDIATRGRQKDIHHISTIAVFPRRLGEHGSIDEDADLMFEGDLSNNGISNGYFQTKWAAEVLFQEARQRGLRVNMYRPASLIGDTQNGTSGYDEFCYRLAAGCRLLGKAPENDTLLDIVPIDVAAKAITQIISKGRPHNQNFNITNKNPIPIQRLFEELQRFGVPLEIIPREEWDRAATEATRGDPMHPLSAIMDIAPGFLAFNPPNYSDRNTAQALNGEKGLLWVEQDLLLASFVRGLLAAGNEHPS